MIHCAAHCTASGNNTEITRDWAGPMIDRLEKESGAITLFFNGLCGDLSPRIPNGRATGDISQAMEVGALAGLDAVRAYKDIRSFRDEEVSVATGVVRLPHAPLIPLEEAQRELAKLESAEQARFTQKNMNVLRKNIEAHESSAVMGTCAGTSVGLSATRRKTLGRKSQVCRSMEFRSRCSRTRNS